MTQIKCGPNQGIVPFSSAINRVFDEFLPGMFTNYGMATFNRRPAVDVVEEDDRVVVRADMPGLEKGDIKVVVNDGLLTIEGQRQEAHDEKRKGFTRAERFVGTFSRSFNLPSWADSSKINANYKDGVLDVVIPKTEMARPKEVEINIG